MPNETEQQPQVGAGGTGDGTAAPGSGAGGSSEGQPAATFAGAQPDQKTATPAEQLAETQEQIRTLTGQLTDSQQQTRTAIASGERLADARVNQALEGRDNKEHLEERKAETGRLEEEARNTEEPDRLRAITARLATINREAAEEPVRAQEQSAAVSAAQIRGIGAAFDLRAAELTIDPAEVERLNASFNAGNYQDVHQRLLVIEQAKAGVKPPATRDELVTENADLTRRLEAAGVDGARRGGGPDTAGGGGGGGGLSYRTKAEARTLHVNNKISNQEMKRINANPNIPEL